MDNLVALLSNVDRHLALKQASSTLKVAKIDCTVNPQVCNQQQIKYYPTIK